jgi:hypothetical protein
VSAPPAVDSPITIAKLNGVDPRAWLADALARINDRTTPRLATLLPWKWQAARHNAVA